MTVWQICAAVGKLWNSFKYRNTSGRNELSGVLLYCDTAVKMNFVFW